MAGTVTVSGGMTMELLSAALTRNEQLDVEQTTVLAADTTQARNLVTTESYDGDAQLGKLNIVGRGASSAGTKIMSPNIYISGTKTDVDVYRLPLA